MEQKKYKLGGLLLVFIATLLSYAGSICSSIMGSMNGTQLSLTEDASEVSQSISGVPIALSITVSVILLVSLILQIVGIGMLRKVNKKFKSAFALMIVTIILTVLVVIFCIIFGVFIASDLLNSGDITAIVILIFILIIAVIVLSVVSLCFEYNMLYGCRDVALDFGDQRFAKKVKKTWGLYIIGFILSLIALVLFVVFGYLNAEKIMALDLTDIDPQNLISSFAIMIIPLILLAAGAIIEFIAQIMILVRYIMTYITFNGKSPGGNTPAAPDDIYAGTESVDSYMTDIPVDNAAPEAPADSFVYDEFNNNGPVQ